MKVHQELLNHFTCNQCQYWWSIASVKFELGQKLYCPWCQHENIIDEICVGGNLDYAERDEAIAPGDGGAA